MSSGRNDPLVKFQWQSQMMEELKKLHQTATDGKAWGPNGTWYESDHATPLATIIYDGGHAPPPDLGQRIVEFFKTVSPDPAK
jgi:hypothetical protein